MAYIGKEPIVGNFQKCDAITVVNGQAAYTLQVSSTNVIPESANHMLVSLNGILQSPVTSFTVSGSTLTFASNLATGDVIDFVILLGNVLDLGTPSDGTVTNAKLAQDIISGETALASTPADTDEFLVSDAGTLKRIDYSLIKGGGKIGQVVSTTLTSTVSTTSTTATNLTGVVAAITPSATSSKILILVSLTTSHTNQYYRVHFKLTGGNTASYIGDAATGHETAMTATHIRAGYSLMSNNMNYLDSPSSTSEVTYQVQWWTEGGTAYIGRPATIDANGGNTASTITLMEVLA